jgi:hypothetical protein
MSSVANALEGRETGRASNRERAGKLAFAMWACASLALVASLMVAHWYILPSPDKGDPVTSRALAALRGPGDAERWLAVHVLYGRCRCSQRIVDHLVATRRPEGVKEVILLVGEDPGHGERAARAGFTVVRLSPAELERDYHIVAAPLLAIVAPDGSLRYTGGYTGHKQGPDIRDVALIEETRARGSASPLPLFGCAVSKELQELIDPLRLKYQD